MVSELIGTLHARCGSTLGIAGVPNGVRTFNLVIFLSFGPFFVMVESGVRVIRHEDSVMCFLNHLSVTTVFQKQDGTLLGWGRKKEQSTFAFDLFTRRTG